MENQQDQNYDQDQKQQQYGFTKEWWSFLMKQYEDEDVDHDQKNQNDNQKDQKQIKLQFIDLHYMKEDTKKQVSALTPTIYNDYHHLKSVDTVIPNLIKIWQVMFRSSEQAAKSWVRWVQYMMRHRMYKKLALVSHFFHHPDPKYGWDDKTTVMRVGVKVGVKVAPKNKHKVQKNNEDDKNQKQTWFDFKWVHRTQGLFYAVVYTGGSFSKLENNILKPFLEHKQKMESMGLDHRLVQLIVLTDASRLIPEKLYDDHKQYPLDWIKNQIHVVSCDIKQLVQGNFMVASHIPCKVLVSPLVSYQTRKYRTLHELLHRFVAHQKQQQWWPVSVLWDADDDLIYNLTREQREATRNNLVIYSKLKEEFSVLTYAPWILYA